MSIIITNDGSNPAPDGDHGYILRINNTIIARFTHRREDGLAACLARAAAAAAQAEYDRQAKLATALLRMGEEP